MIWRVSVWMGRIVVGMGGVVEGNCKDDNRSWSVNGEESDVEGGRGERKGKG